MESIVLSKINKNKEYLFFYLNVKNSGNNKYTHRNTVQNRLIHMCNTLNIKFINVTPDLISTLPLINRIKNKSLIYLYDRAPQSIFFILKQVNCIKIISTNFYNKKEIEFLQNLPNTYLVSDLFSQQYCVPIPLLLNNSLIQKQNCKFSIFIPICEPRTLSLTTVLNLIKNFKSELIYIKDNTRSSPQTIKQIGSNIWYLRGIDNDLYNDLLQKCKIMILPYKKEYYDTHSSGMLIDAIKHKMLLLSTNTVATEIIDLLQIGTTNFTQFESTLYQMIKQYDNLVKNYETNKQIIKQYLDNWSVNNFINFIKQIQNKLLVEFTIQDQWKKYYGFHRSGWSYVVKQLHLKTEPMKNSVILDSFIERSFAWNDVPKKVYINSWIGIVHLPPNIPNWFNSEQSFSVICTSPYFLKSLATCKGLITLSNSTKSFLEKHPIIKKLNIRIYKLLHPAEPVLKQFCIKQYNLNCNKMLVQIGWWLRRYSSIYELNVPIQKAVLQINKKTVINVLLRDPKNKVCLNREINGVKVIKQLSDTMYDQLLSENIVFVDLYDSNANNIIVECIMRNTPIIINKVGGVVDYLGEKYPLYFTKLEEVSALLEKVEDGYNYLKNMNKSAFSIDNFIQSLQQIVTNEN